MSSASQGAQIFSTPKRSWAGGGGGLPESDGLRFAPEKEEVPMASPWRRQHARASSVPFTTPFFSRVVTRASGNALVVNPGGQSAVPEVQKL